MMQGNNKRAHAGFLPLCGEEKQVLDPRPGAGMELVVDSRVHHGRKVGAGSSCQRVAKKIMFPKDVLE